MTLAELVLSANTGADAIKKAPIVEKNTGLRCLRIGDISQKREYSEWGFTKTTEADYMRYKLEPGDLIIARTGNTIGVNCIIEDEINSVYNNGLIRIKVDESKVIPRYFWYMISSKNCQDFIQAIAYGTSTQPNMKIKDFLKYSFEYRDLNVQKKVVEIIDPIDKKIKTNMQINRNLSEQAFALFKEMFPNVNQGEHTLGEYLSAVKGKALLSKDAVEGDVPVIAGGLSPATYHNVANTKAPVLTISASGANAGYVALWNVDVWSSDSSYIDSNMTENVYFWYVMLKTRQKEIFDAHTGSVQPHIYPKNIDDLSVAELDRKIVTDYTMQVSPLFELIGKNIKENERLIILRDSLLPKLMSGDLNVSNLYI